MKHYEIAMKMNQATYEKLSTIWEAGLAATPSSIREESNGILVKYKDFYDFCWSPLRKGIQDLPETDEYEYYVLTVDEEGVVEEFKQGESVDEWEEEFFPSTKIVYTNEVLATLHANLMDLLCYAPKEEECTFLDNEVYSEMANLKQALEDAGYVK